MNRPRAVLIDIDGVLTVSWQALPGAVQAFAAVQESVEAVALLTNTTSRTRASIAQTLTEQGFELDVEQILTAPLLTAGYLEQAYPQARCLLLNSGDIRPDLAGLTLVDDLDQPAPADQDDDEPSVQVVIVGGAGPEFGYLALNQAFRQLQRGARLVAMHRNLSWQTDDGLQLDAGAFLLGLERAAHTKAEVIGKPAAAFFETAVHRLGVGPAEAMMVGDDVESDVLGAQRAGLTGVLVKTGKYRPESLRDADGEPDHLLDSFADVPGLLDQLSE